MRSFHRWVLARRWDEFFRDPQRPWRLGFFEFVASLYGHDPLWVAQDEDALGDYSDYGPPRRVKRSVLKHQLKGSPMLESNIARIVAFVLTPILVPFSAVVASWVQDKLGFDLDGAQLTALVVTTAAGVAVTIATWLRGRGEWEKAVHLAATVHDRGQDAVGAPGPRVIP